MRLQSESGSELIETETLIQPFTSAELVEALPHQKLLLQFVDKILLVNDDYIEGKYKFKLTESFYSGHFLRTFLQKSSNSWRNFIRIPSLSWYSGIYPLLIPLLIIKRI